MKLQFRKRQIETICTYVAYILLILVLILWIFYQADHVFHWDILPANAQRIIEGFIIPSVGGIIFITVFLSILLNFSLLSNNVEKIAEAKSNLFEEEKTDVKITSHSRKTLLISIVVIASILIGFKLWDKHLENKRLEDFIEEYANPKTLHTLDSLLSKINYQDSLQWRIKQKGDYSYIEIKNDSVLGLSNKSILNKLRHEFEKLNETFLENNKQTSLESELLINFNKSWLGINNYGHYLIFDHDDNNKFLELNLSDFREKRIFKRMDGVEITKHDDYEIYYRINDSRNFEIAIMSKTKPTAILNFEYRIW